MKTCVDRHSLWPMLFLIAVVVLASATPVRAQTSRDNGPSPAIDQMHSRAEQEADRLVALSADRIVSVLEAEPGLLLQVKKLLVRKAYEQGRMLDPEDLTDDAVLRLVRQDQNVRALITREMEDRGYVHVNPSREELAAREREARRATDNENGIETAGFGKGRYSRDDNSWPGREQNGGFSQPAAPYSAPQPEQPAAGDSQRRIDRAQVPPLAPDVTESLQPAGALLPRISPEQLPSLLAAASTGNGDLANLAASLTRTGLGSGIQLSPSAQSAIQSVLASGALGSPGSGSSSTPPGPPEPAPDRATPPAPAPPPIYPAPDPLAAQHEANPYADVPSLYDLYEQYSNHSPSPERFGTDVFRNGTGNSDRLPMDMPVGPDYVLGPGDELTINFWGGVSQRLQRMVDREGRISLPEIGSIDVNGRSLGEVQRVIQAALRTQFRDVETDVSLGRLRTVRVYVVGDVERPGAYDVSSLSTPLNAVFTAGGPTSRGSLRVLEHFRGKQLVQEVDVYDLLLHGVRSGLDRLEPGDTVLVPTLRPEITVEGMVRRPAIYELNGEKSLADVLQLAGGVLPTGTLRQIEVDRLQAHDHRAMLRVDLPAGNNQEAVNAALANFQIQDGDKIRISPILPYSGKAVYLDGHVFRPGKYAYTEGMRVSDVIHSYADLLPEPYKAHAEVIRLNPPDYRPVVLAFNLDDALAGKQQDLALKPLDTIRVFGRYDFEDPPVVTVSGEVRDPGDHVTNGATYLRDAVFLAGGPSPDAELDDVQVFRQTEDGKLKVLSVNLGKALAGDKASNLLLQPKDRVFIHRDMSKLDPPSVTIQGEVARPGKYPLGAGMTATELVRLAGGLKRSAYTREADLTRYVADQGTGINSERMTVPIAEALAGQPDTDVRLHDGDVLAIRQLAGWNDVGATITIKGEVVHPGSYGIQEGERLSSILARAGGFRAEAYPYGAIFERAEIREMEEKSRVELISQLEEEGSALKLIGAGNGEHAAEKQAAIVQWQSTIDNLRNTPPVGRLVLHISSNIKHWANTPADIQVRAGDVIYIPKKPNFVMVKGSVYNETAVAYKPGRNAGWYLQQSGGPTPMGSKKQVFVIRADGSVIGGAGGMFTGSVLDAEVQPGDMVIVPQRTFGGAARWQNTLQVAQMVQAVGIAVQVARSF